MLHGGEAEAREPQPAPAAAGGREGRRAGGSAGRCRRIRRGYSWHHFPEPEVTGRRARSERAARDVTGFPPRAGGEASGARPAAPGGGVMGAARPCLRVPVCVCECVRRRGERCAGRAGGERRREGGREGGRASEGEAAASPRGRRRPPLPLPLPPRELPGEPVPTRRAPAGRRVSSPGAGSSCPLHPSLPPLPFLPSTPSLLPGQGHVICRGRTIHRRGSPAGAGRRLRNLPAGASAAGHGSARCRPDPSFHHPNAPPFPRGTAGLAATPQGRQPAGGRHAEGTPAAPGSARRQHAFIFNSLSPPAPRRSAFPRQRPVPPGGRAGGRCRRGPGTPLVPS